MDEISLDINHAIHGNDLNMLYFVLENIIKNNNIKEFKNLIIELTLHNIYNYNSDDLFEFFVYAINSINLNQTFPDYDTLSEFTIASYYIQWIFNEISGRWGSDPELFRPYINALFDTYIDMDAGEISINDILEITNPGLTNDNWCKNTIRKMINDKIGEENMHRQSKSLVSGLNPVLGMDSPLNFLDLDTYRKLYNSMILPKPDIEKKIIDEYTQDPLIKAEQKLAFAKGFSDPNSSIRIREDHLRDDIGELVSRHRPYPSVHRRFMEDRLRNKPKTKKLKKFAKRTLKNRRRRNRF